MLHKIRTTLKPTCYHGRGKKPPFFEGWYYKLIDRAGNQRYAVIPGVYLAKDGGNSHAFIQILNGNNGQSSYHSFPLSDFSASEKEFDVRIGANRFTSEYLSLNIKDAGKNIRGELHFDSLTPWPVSLLSPGIMGWYAWAPFMECYHGIVSLDHSIRGILRFADNEINFTGGRGYSEKDWGRSFPSAWVWFQSNHFPEAGISLTASVAVIPWIRKPFPGFIVGFWHAGELFRFATYTGAWIEHFRITDKDVALNVRDRQFRLAIFASKSEGGLLHAPTTMEMDRRISETLTASVDVKLTRLDARERVTIYEGIGKHAGMETNGDLQRLVDMWETQKRSS